MDAQELRNLQEAYMEVIKEYELPYDRAQRIRAQTSSSSAYDRAQTNRADYYGRAQTNRADYYGRAQKPKIKKPKTQREEVDIYDIILSHLLDEGYAETPEAAEVIMVNMSEEWKDSIIG